MGFPLPEHRLPALAPLLDGGLWAGWCAEGKVFPVDDLRASVGYLRLKPETSCRLTVIASASGKGERPPRGSSSTSTPTFPEPAPRSRSSPDARR